MKKISTDAAELGIRPLGRCVVTGGRGWVGKRLVHYLQENAAAFGVTEIISADIAPLSSSKRLSTTPRDEEDQDRKCAEAKMNNLQVSISAASNSTNNEFPHVREVICDVSNSEAEVTAQLFTEDKGERVDTVFHLAAVIDLRTEKQSYFDHCLRVNCVGTENVYKAFCSNAVNKAAGKSCVKSSATAPARTSSPGWSPAGTTSTEDVALALSSDRTSSSTFEEVLEDAGCRIPVGKARMIHVSSHDATYNYDAKRNSSAKPFLKMTAYGSSLQINSPCPYARSKARTEKRLQDLHAGANHVVAHVKQENSNSDRISCSATSCVDGHVAEDPQEPSSANVNNIDLICVRPTHVCDFGEQFLLDPVARDLSTVPFRISCARDKKMSFVSVETLVIALVQAARVVDAARVNDRDAKASGSVLTSASPAFPVYYVKDLDCNFFDFYFRYARKPMQFSPASSTRSRRHAARIRRKSAKCQIYLPAPFLLAVAWLADVVWLGVYSVFRGRIFERHPFLGLRYNGVWLPCSDMISDDAEARRRLQYRSNQKLVEMVGLSDDDGCCEADDDALLAARLMKGEGLAYQSTSEMKKSSKELAKKQKCKALDHGYGNHAQNLAL
ncbi:unnamed protein product [Amoebophrya sp. A120]|nr:unnamed protein product [Amoebophrya sp. A120]|eukprot:GSA120T00004025001.1